VLEEKLVHRSMNTERNVNEGEISQWKRRTSTALSQEKLFLSPKPTTKLIPVDNNPLI